MRERSDARAAIDALDKLNIDGHTISVEWALDKNKNDRNLVQGGVEVTTN